MISFFCLLAAIFVHICTSEIIGSTIKQIQTMMDPLLCKGDGLPKGYVQ